MSKPRSSALSEARRAQLGVIRWHVQNAWELAYRRAQPAKKRDSIIPSPDFEIGRLDVEQAVSGILDALLRAEAAPPAALPAETPRAETCGAAPPFGGCERAPGHGGDHETADGIAWRNEHPDAYRRPPQASRAVEGDE